MILTTQSRQIVQLHVIEFGFRMALDSDVKRFLGIWAGAVGKNCPKMSNNKCVTDQGTNLVVY